MQILKYTVLIACFIFTCFVINDFFIRPWRIDNSIKRVEDSSSYNFDTNVKDFYKLREFLTEIDLNPITEIEFLQGKKFRGSVNKSLMVDSTLFEHGVGRRYFLDTIVATHNLDWDTDLSEKNFIEYIGITKIEMEELRKLMQKINCEAFSILPDRSISLRYDGNELYQYEYLMASEKGDTPDGYQVLDEGVYAGLYDSGLFCAYYIFRK